jgi:hypothetical protein
LENVLLNPLPVIPLIIGGNVTDCNIVGNKLLASPNADCNDVKLFVPSTAHTKGLFVFQLDTLVAVGL